jgi:protein TonB
MKAAVAAESVALTEAWSAGERAASSTGGRGRAKMILIGLVVALLCVALGWSVYSAFAGKSSAARKPPKISLIPTAPPPPPPPPPKEEKRPEPPKQQEIKTSAPPEQKPVAPTPTQDLKMEGAAGDGPSAFSAGRVTNENQIPEVRGADTRPPPAPPLPPPLPPPPPPVVVVPPAPVVVAPAAPRNPFDRSGLFDPIANYGRLLKTEAQRHFNQNRALRQRAYRAEILLWIAEDGRVMRYELSGTSGDEETDVLLRESLASLSGFSGAPPAGAAQPVRLAITTSSR